MQFTDAERRRQSIWAKRSGRKVQNELNTLATPDTLIRRYPDLIGAKWECFVRPIKEECLSRMICFGQASLRHGVKHFMAHCYAERNHQGLGNRLLQSISASAALNRRVRQCQRLGGMLSYYYREAA